MALNSYFDFAENDFQYFKASYDAGIVANMMGAKMCIRDRLEGSQFAKIMQKGLMLNELNQNISRLFPQEFKGLFRLGSITNGKLFIEVKSAVVRQGILFRQSELLTAIQSTYPEVKGFEIKINPELTC